MQNILWLILLYFSYSAMSLMVFTLLIKRHWREMHLNLHAHSVARVLAVLSFFLFIDGFYNFMMLISQVGAISPTIFVTLSDMNLQILPQIGIFISTIFVVYFVMEDRIRDIKEKEKAMTELEDLNTELEGRARELEIDQKKLNGKISELEKYNNIAKEREIKMLDLIEKIEMLEDKLKVKKGQK